MNVPEYLHDHVLQLIAIQTAGAIADRIRAERSAHWAAVLHLVPHMDGPLFTFLWGDNIQDGVFASGETVEEALINFDKEFVRATGAPGSSGDDARSQLAKANSEIERYREELIQTKTEWGRAENRWAISRDEWAGQVDRLRNLIADSMRVQCTDACKREAYASGNNVSRSVRP
jgi:hypothetical protein